MRQDLVLLKLGDYLQEVSLPLEMATFARALPATSKLPELTVGLAITGQFFSLKAVPAMADGNLPVLNGFVNEVAELYLRYSNETPDMWEERILLDLGYVSRKPFDNISSKREMKPLSQDHALFAAIPKDERLPLLRKYGFHKLATLVSHGFAENLDEIIAALESPELEALDTNLSQLMYLLTLGVPTEDLAMAAQLPEDMLEGIYGE